MATLTELLDRTKPDPIRDQTPFSPELSRASDALFNADVGQHSRIIDAWLQKNQPCLFGRIAAQRGMLSHAVLTEKDIALGDESVRDRLLEARRQWLRDALSGKKSGFVFGVVSRRLTYAIPDVTVLAFARRLLEFYLSRKDLETDTVYLDSVRLEVPGESHATFEWDVGMNYFSAHGDRRWWHDHRFPGGVFFSLNSIGHMVKSTVVSQGMSALEARLDIESDDRNDSTVDSLGKALRLAMMTIDRAADTPSGRATYLLPRKAPNERRADCPIELPLNLIDKDHCEYAGYYDTDATLPSAYFDARIDRPGTAPLTLDFTYLFDRSLDNPDYSRMGQGRRVRLQSGVQEQTSRAVSKRGQVAPRRIKTGRSPS